MRCERGDGRRPAEGHFVSSPKALTVGGSRAHIGASELKEVVLEPRAGGRWYEIGVDGTECNGPRPSVDPPHGSFSPGRSTPPGTSIQAGHEGGGRFIADTPERTTVELEHRDSSASVPTGHDAIRFRLSRWLAGTARSFRSGDRVADQTARGASRPPFLRCGRGAVAVAHPVPSDHPTSGR